MTTPHVPVIRPREVADLPGCVDALAAVHASGVPYPSRWPADPIAWLTPADVAQGWVAVIGDTVVGQVLLRDTPGHGHNISRLYVSPAAQGAGIASGLLGAAVGWARERSLPLTLEVRTDAAAAIALYERTGWRRTATTEASWTTPGNTSIQVHHYTLDA
ncbi:N-acetyltransferase [Catellatospora sp. TT07R-123]|uniref:GNAT family N-acetyltransferase n=1 Tax=Catellatospora sp. TT07R-123 TaxID=2733863 RepID=UPI001BB3445D|nr:GNAT family N-acetyltransferase [Catellatospora sp. TT07R-123]